MMVCTMSFYFLSLCIIHYFQLPVVAAQVDCSLLLVKSSPAGTIRSPLEQVALKLPTGETLRLSIGALLVGVEEVSLAFSALLSEFPTFFL